MYRFGTTSSFHLMRIGQGRVRSVLSVTSAVCVAIGIGIAMLYHRNDCQSITHRFSTQEFFGETEFIACMICSASSIWNRRVYQFTNVRAGRYPCKAYMSSLFPVFVGGDRVAIDGRAVSVFRPYLGQRILMLVERFIWFCDRTQRRPYMIVFIRYHGAGTAIAYVGAYAVR